MEVAISCCQRRRLRSCEWPCRVSRGTTHKKQTNSSGQFQYVSIGSQSGLRLRSGFLLLGFALCLMLLLTWFFSFFPTCQAVSRGSLDFYGYFRSSHLLSSPLLLVCLLRLRHVVCLQRGNHMASLRLLCARFSYRGLAGALWRGA